METVENLLSQLNEVSYPKHPDSVCTSQVLSKRLFSTSPLFIKVTRAPFRGGGATRCDRNFGKKLPAFIEHLRHAADWMKCCSMCINSTTHRDTGTETKSCSWTVAETDCQLRGLYSLHACRATDCVRLLPRHMPNPLLAPCMKKD